MQFPIVIEECKSRQCLANVHIGMDFVHIPLDGAVSAVQLANCSDLSDMRNKLKKHFYQKLL